MTKCDHIGLSCEWCSTPFTVEHHGSTQLMGLTWKHVIRTYRYAAEVGDMPLFWVCEGALGGDIKALILVCRWIDAHTD